MLENTYVLNTYYSIVEKEEENLLRDFTFGVNDYTKFYEKFKITDGSGYSYKGQSLRKESVKLMLSKFKYDEDYKTISSENDKHLENAFVRTMYIKTLIRNDIYFNGNSKNQLSIKEKLETILKHLCVILDIGNNDSDHNCNGGAFFSVRYNDTDKLPTKIEAGDISIVGDFNFECDNILKDDASLDNTLLLDLYKGIREKKNKKYKSTLEITDPSEKNIALTDSKGENLDLYKGIREKKNKKHKSTLEITDPSEKNIALTDSKGENIEYNNKKRVSY